LDLPRVGGWEEKERKMRRPEIRGGKITEKRVYANVKYTYRKVLTETTWIGTCRPSPS